MRPGPSEPALLTLDAIHARIESPADTHINSRPTLSGRRPATAAAVMTPNPKSINHQTPARETAEALQQNGIQAAPVIDDAGRPMGVVSRTDLLDYWNRGRYRAATLAAGDGDAASNYAEEAGNELTTREIMTPLVFAVGLDTPIPSIVEKMIGLEVHSLFVTDGDGVLVGTINVFDVLRHLIRCAPDYAGKKTPNDSGYPSVPHSSVGLAGLMPP
jgi:CBS domain-containing protein